MYLTTFAQYYNRQMMDSQDHGWGAGVMFFSFLFFVLVIMGILYLIRGHAHPGHHVGMHSQTPIDTAKQRYAAGEITKAEFEQIKKDIS